MKRWFAIVAIIICFLIIAFFLISTYQDKAVDEGETNKAVDEGETKIIDNSGAGGFGNSNFTGEEQTCLPLNNKENLPDWSTWDCTRYYTGEECIQIQNILKDVQVNEFIPNFNDEADEKKINLIFIGHKYSSVDKFTNIISQISGIDESGQLKNEGFFTMPPFNNYKDRFNIWYVFEPKTQFDLEIGLRTEIRERFENKYIVLAELVNRKFEYNPEAVLVSRGAAATGSNYIWFDIPENILDPARNESLVKYRNDIVSYVFPHEFGHVFGLLMDEYLYAAQQFHEPGFGILRQNCGTANTNQACSNWCAGKPKSIDALKEITCDVAETEDVFAICGSKINSGLPCACVNCATQIGSEPSDLPPKCINVVSYCTSQQTKSECENGLHVEDICKWNGGSDANDFQPIVDLYFNSICVPIDISTVDIGTDCLEGTGCYQQCARVNLYRSTPKSIMRRGQEFGGYSKIVLEDCLKKLTE